MQRNLDGAKTKDDKLRGLVRYPVAEVAESVPRRGRGVMEDEVEKKQLKVCWLSAGVSSFIAGYLVRDTVDKYIYIDIDNQHPDSMRFIKCCERVFGKQIEILQSPYRNVQNVIQTFRYVSGVAGAKCTEVLKKCVRKEWEDKNADYDITYVWGFDCNERHRAERIEETMADFRHQFPLIENGLTKQDAHGMLDRLNVKRPMMYDIGYSNNNCVGCVKGGKGYWNKIRLDFPDVFDRMAKLEREIGHSCINGVFLDELDPNAGRMSEEIMEDCGIFCSGYGAQEVAKDLVLIGDDFWMERAEYDGSEWWEFVSTEPREEVPFKTVKALSVVQGGGIGWRTLAKLNGIKEDD